MIEITRKIVVAGLVWLLVLTPMHTAMASINMMAGDADAGYFTQDSVNPPFNQHRHQQTHQQSHQKILKRGDTHYHDHNVHHQAYKQAHKQANVISSDSHCQQDKRCKGCDICSHCMSAICNVVQFNMPSVQNGFAPLPVFSYQVDLSADFRPPKHS